MKEFYVYILASKRNGTLYIGVSSGLIRRVYIHKNDILDGFSKRYQTHMLVYYEKHDNWEEAVRREKQIKKWNRAWKLRLIEENNPMWDDLYKDIIQ